MARHISMPSFMSTFMSTKRSKAITVAAAGTLTLAAAISAVTVTLPSSSSPVQATADAAFSPTVSQQAGAYSTQSVAASARQQTALFAEVRAYQAHRYEQQFAAEKAAAARTAAHQAAAEKAAAEKKAAAAKAAAQAAKQSARAAQPTQQAQPAQAAAITTPSGSPQQIAQQMLGQFGWSTSQFSCLQPLWQQESGWNLSAENPSSGAYGIPQALPGSQMASAGADWQTNAATQIRWGLTYIQSRYGSPCGAWAHEEADGWY